ncbi:MAG: ATP-dependent helicase HrpB [Myxococcota bacterium]
MTRSTRADAPAGPRADLPVDLPVRAALSAIAEALRTTRRAVVVAPPGSGKTTLVAPYLLESGLAGRGEIVLLQPRRVAARTVARRMAAARGERVGETVGFQVRYENETSERTRIRVITEGILTARMQRDPGLGGVSVVVLDEFHERSIHADLALALVKEVQDALRDDLMLVVMSATLDAGPIAAYLGGAPIVRAEGRQYPIDVRYLERAVEGPIEGAVASGVLDLVDRHTLGDVLAFLPGVRTIDGARQRLAGPLAERGRDVVPLHGSLDARDQDKALEPGARPRVVLATNIAETSLTIPGVTAVVDAGLAKVMRYDLGVGSGRLETERISLASAEQRAGRAGRLGPGMALRLWTRFEHERLQAFDDAEIFRIDLARVVLELKTWGVADVARFPWFEAPDARALADAEARLRDLGALDASGLTALGRKLAAVPADPRVAAFLAAARDRDRAARLAALIEDEASGDVATAPAGPWVERGARQLAKAIGPPDGRGLDLAASWLAGFGDRVAVRREDHSYQMVGGRRAKAATDLPLLVALRLEAGRRGAGALSEVRLWAAIDQADLDTTTELELVWDASAERVLAFKTTRYRDLALDRRSTPNVDRERAGAMVAAMAVDAIDRLFTALSPDDDQALARLVTLARQHPELELPATRSAWIAACLPALAAGRSSFEDLVRRPAVSIATAAHALLSWPAQKLLRDGFPERIETPSGSHIRLDYQLEGPPVLAVKVQEVFGLETTPSIDGGRLPVVLHLLSPAQRPLQVTRDLKSFWTRTWPAVRAEMRTRYPKHHWPEDPARALPSAKTTARRLKPEE